jgi:hypothetical protein
MPEGAAAAAAAPQASEDDFDQSQGSPLRPAILVLLIHIKFGTAVGDYPFAHTVPYP